VLSRFHPVVFKRQYEINTSAKWTKPRMGLGCSRISLKAGLPSLIFSKSLENCQKPSRIGFWLPNHNIQSRGLSGSSSRALSGAVLVLAAL
jgi:hypothetical protein